jgi:hypothetical protein
VENVKDSSRYCCCANVLLAFLHIDDVRLCPIICFHLDAEVSGCVFTSVLYCSWRDGRSNYIDNVLRSSICIRSNAVVITSQSVVVRNVGIFSATVWRVQ